jgi:nitroreductase
MTDTIDLILRRRSIRRFSEQPVAETVLTRLLEAAMAAPSAMNLQPWEFIVVTDPELLRQLRERLIFGRYHAPAAMIVCGHPGVTLNPAAGQFWVQDCSAAVENLLIAAVGMGLGTVWVGVHPITPFVNSVRHVCRIPKSITPMALIYIGYPAEEKPPRTRYKPERVHWQTFK